MWLGTVFLARLLILVPFIRVTRLSAKMTRDWLAVATVFLTVIVLVAVGTRSAGLVIRVSTTSSLWRHRVEMPSAVLTSGVRLVRLRVAVEGAW